MALSAKHAAAVRKAVKSGAYRSGDDVVRQRQIIDDEVLRQLWKDDLESGTAGPWDADEFLSWARKRKAKERKAGRTAKR